MYVLEILGVIFVKVFFHGVIGMFFDLFWWKSSVEQMNIEDIK